MEELKEGWRRVKLGELINSVSETFKTPNEKVILINTSDVLEGKVLNHELVENKNLKGQFKKKFENGDILYSEIRPQNKRFARIDFDASNYIASTKLMVLRNKNREINSDFLYLILKSNKFIEKLQTIAESRSGTFPQITFNDLANIEIELPLLETQEKIASILSALDDKIEINNEMNKTLEEMAQTLFKRWFIDFDFQNENGEPYRSSGGKMVDSELGEIPEGWEIDSIYELADYINGTSFKSNEYGDHGLPVIKIVELKNGITDSTKFCISDKDKKFHLKNGEILFSWSGNPQTSIDIFIWSLGKAILNQHTFKVIPYNEKIDSYIYFLLKYLKPKFCDIASNKQTTGLGHVTVKDLKNLKIAFNYEQIYKFCEISENILKKLLNNQQEIQSLIETRDTLLPKLMSGEIEV